MMRETLCSIFWLLFLVGLSIVIVAPAWPAQYIITPSLGLRETYDDNVFFRDIDDFEHFIAPALKLDARTDRAHWQTSAAWAISDYQRHSELDTVDQAYQCSVDAAPSDLWQLTLFGQYVDDYTFVSALEESGIVAERSRRKSATVKPGAAFVLNPRDTLGLTYEFNKTQYEFEGYPDYRLHGLNVSWFHDLLNERTRVICTVGGNQVDFKAANGDITQRTYRALAGLDHRFTERLQVRLMAGARYTESEFPSTEVVFVHPDSVEVTTKTVEDDDSGFIVDGSLNWRFEQITLSATVNRDVTPSIYGELITRDRVTTGFTYQWSDKLRGGLSAAYYLSETDGVVSRQDWETYALRPSMTYRFTEAINLQLGYSYTWTENRITDRSEDRNRIFAEISLAWPKQID